MPLKITKKKFIEAIEYNEEGLTSKELAGYLGISVAYFYQLRQKYRENIKDIALEMTKGIASEQIYNLRRNAAKGDTAAAIKLLEMAKVYTPGQKVEHSGEHKLEVTLIKSYKVLLEEEKIDECTEEGGDSEEGSG